MCCKETKWDGSIVFFGVRDLERTHRFYHELLGLDLNIDQGKCRIYQVTGGGMLGFCSHLSPAPNKKDPIITLLTPDVDMWYRKLAAAGVNITGEPKLNEQFKIYHFFLQDPDGYAVEIQKFL